MSNESEDIKVLNDILDLDRIPVMVKFLKTEDDINFQNFDNPKVWFCQALNLAQTGKDILLGKENISFPAAAAAFDFKQLLPILSSGNMLYNMGLFIDPQTGRKMMEQVSRLELGRFHNVALTSNLDAGGSYVIIIETHPENIMWMLLASIYKSGERPSLSTGVFQAACVDSAVIPFKTGRVNACWGCYGCRDATDILVRAKGLPVFQQALLAKWLKTCLHWKPSLLKMPGRRWHFQLLERFWVNRYSNFSMSRF